MFCYSNEKFLHSKIYHDSSVLCLQVWFQNRRARLKREATRQEHKKRANKPSPTILPKPSGVSTPCKPETSSIATILPYSPVMPTFVMSLLPVHPTYHGYHFPSTVSSSSAFTRFEPSSPLWSPSFSPSFKKIFEFPGRPISPLPPTPASCQPAEDFVTSQRQNPQPSTFISRSGPDSLTLTVPPKTSASYTPVHVPGIPAPSSLQSRDVTSSGESCSADDLSPVDSVYSSADNSDALIIDLDRSASDSGISHASD